MISRIKFIRLPLLGLIVLSPLAASQLSAADKPAEAPVAAPRVTVSKVTPAQFIEKIDVVGTFIAQEEVLISPQVESLQIIEILVDEGDKVTKGQVLARLNRATLDAQLAQWNATLAVADASIAQAASNVTQAEAAIALSSPALARAQDLLKMGAGTSAVLEQRQSDQRSNEARLASARSGLILAKADKTSKEAQRNELLVRLSRTEVVAPVDGTVTRRAARLGAIASASADPMFRLATNGIVELEADVPELRLSKVKPDQSAQVIVGEDVALTGKVRRVLPEVDKATRLGKVRISLPEDARIHIGAFARGTIELARRSVLSVPAAAVLYDAGDAVLQTVSDGHVTTKKVTLGLMVDGRVEITSGLTAGETIIERAGAFLRSGDAISPVEAPPLAQNNAQGAVQ